MSHMSARFKIAQADGTTVYPAYTSMGCYPLMYRTAMGACMCAECANKAGDPEETSDLTEASIVDAGVNWSDDSLWCDFCEEQIECACASEG